MCYWLQSQLNVALPLPFETRLEKPRGLLIIGRKLGKLLKFGASFLVVDFDRPNFGFGLW
jgi:hypothetical protein